MGAWSRELWSKWDRFWFAEIPPHIYSLLRIFTAAIAIAGLIGVRDTSVFWDPRGLVPDAGAATLKSLLANNPGIAPIGSFALFVGCLVCYVAMAVGFRSKLSVGVSLAAAVFQVRWNSLPLSGEHMLLRGLLFCLVWADCGSVWSIDAWLHRRQHALDVQESPSPRTSIAPLRMIQFQVVIVYLASGLWKLFNPLWRNGTALHYVLYNNAFRRFPLQLTPSLDVVLAILTYVVLVWELSFVLLVLFPGTRRIVILIGVVLHLGMTLVLEVGLFPWMMFVCYTSFLDPERLPMLFARSSKSRSRSVALRPTL